MSGSALTPSHANGSSWLATLPRRERMNAQAAKVAKGSRYRGSPDRESRGYTWWTALRPPRPLRSSSWVRSQPDTSVG